MTIATATISGQFLGPDLSAGHTMSATYEAYAEGTVVTYPGLGLIGGRKAIPIQSDGTATVILPKIPQAGLLPASGVQWHVQVKVRGATLDYYFDLAADTTWDTVLTPSNAAAPPGLIAEAQAARDEAVAAAASVTDVRKLVTVDILPTSGVLSAHRAGGGGTTEVYLGPDGALSSARVANALGYQLLDCDYQLTQDNVPVVMHDTTLDRTTNGTGLVSSYPFALLPQIDMRYMVGNGWGNSETVPTLEEWLATLGGRVLLTIEAKDGASSVPQLETLIKGYGLEKSVFINCLVTDTACMDAVVGAGLLLHVYGATTTTDVTTADTHGAWLVEVPYNASTTVVNAALLATNIQRVIAAPIKKRIERDAMTAGLQGYVSDAIGYLDKVTDRRDIVAELATQKVAPGWYNPGAATGNVTSRTFPKFGTNGMMLSQASPSSRRDVMMGSLSGPKPGTYNLDLSIWTGGWVGDTNGRLTLRACCPSDEGTNSDADTRGYPFTIRKSGQMILWSGPVGYGAATAISTINLGGATADSTVATWRCRLSVTPTTVSLTRLDVVSATLSGTVTAGTVTSLPVNAIAGQINSGGRLLLPNGQYANVSSQANAGATSISVTSFTLANNLPSGASLYLSTGAIANTDWRGDYIWVGGSTGSGNYPMELTAAFWGVPAANLSAAVSAGTVTSLPVFPLAAAIPSGTAIRLPDGTRMNVSSTAAINATSISVTSVTVPAMKAGDVVYLA